ncbi:MAG TPA: anti-sigma factor [Vicinamibacterales bacterium]|nr:anti-sigma factor [Vicinamibacterales bacterium]
MRPLEPTPSDLQAQLDRLSLTVQMGREGKGSLEPATQQLARLAERCNEILSRWQDADALHSHVVNEAEMRLTEWGAIENRLEQDYAKRLKQLEDAIGHEWQALRRIHEEPVKQLRQEAAALSEVAVSAANLALQGFERAEARLEAFEASLQTQLSRLSEDVQTALADHRRALAAPALPDANVTPFPLEGVMRIHDDLRSDAPDAAHETQGSLAIVPREFSDDAARLSARVESLEREVTIERQEHDTATRAEKIGRTWRVAIGALGLAILGAAAVAAVITQRNMDARLTEAAARVTAAERQAAAANQQIAATRADAERQIAQARQTALEAGIVGNVLVAPDLVRFNLVGTERAPRAFAQVLWSRSRGLVLSASALPALADGTTYQIWLLSESGAASVGTVAPDASGRASLAVENPANLPRAVNGVSVTIESGSQQTAPSSSLVLVRLQQ